MKILLIIFMFLGCSYIGYSASKNYYRREKFFGELLMFCNALINNIKFNKNKLKIIIEDFFNNCSNDMKECLKNYLDDNIQNISFLSKYDNKRIAEFLSGLGGFNSSGEIGYIENYKSYFSDCYNKYIEDNKRYGALYSKLGFMVGLVLVILFI